MEDPFVLNRVQKILGLLLTTGVLLGALTVPVAANTAGFSASPQIPENQIEGNGYFNLMMSPGGEQDLIVSVENLGDQEITVTVEAYTAITNANGLISYSEKGVLDETMQHAFASLATVHTPELTVPPRSTGEAVVSVKMPAEEFDGIVLGGIRVLKALTQEEISESGPVAHQYSYVIAAMLRENDKAVEAEFQPGAVTTEIVNERAAIVTEIRNVQPAMVKAVEVVNQILLAGSNEPIMESTLPNAEFAPNSVLRISQVDEEGLGLASGDYISRTTLRYGGQQWNHDEEFTIEPAAAQAVNDSALNQNVDSGVFSGFEENRVPAILLLVAGALLLLLAAFFIVKFIGKTRAENKEIAEQLKALEKMQKNNS